MVLQGRVIGRDLFPSYSAEQRAMIRREFARRASVRRALTVVGSAALLVGVGGSLVYRPLLLGMSPPLAVALALIVSGLCALCALSLLRCPGCERYLARPNRTLSCPHCAAELR